MIPARAKLYSAKTDDTKVLYSNLLCNLTKSYESVICQTH